MQRNQKLSFMDIQSIMTTYGFDYVPSFGHGVGDSVEDYIFLVFAHCWLGLGSSRSFFGNHQKHFISVVAVTSLETLEVLSSLDFPPWIDQL
ncbi:hypothetical protein PIB30_057978 [Stylosanthes scabra]|uniref:Uncharacterized protein n=1 Tax=Stylosanthes scabra TaxID=79078 RepID=A0ABU6TJN2_9FABA|nr:hypothetical protein [Stylosanthes scabra]